MFLKKCVLALHPPKHISIYFSILNLILVTNTFSWFFSVWEKSSEVFFPGKGRLVFVFSQEVLDNKFLMAGHGLSYLALFVQNLKFKYDYSRLS